MSPGTFPIETAHYRQHVTGITPLMPCLDRNFSPLSPALTRGKKSPIGLQRLVQMRGRSKLSKMFLFVTFLERSYRYRAKLLSVVVHGRYTDTSRDRTVPYVPHQASGTRGISLSWMLKDATSRVAGDTGARWATQDSAM